MDGDAACLICAMKCPCGHFLRKFRSLPFQIVCLLSEAADSAGTSAEQTAASWQLTSACSLYRRTHQIATVAAEPGCLHEPDPSF